MATLVFFHAHPDDEAIGTGGIIAKASALGHRTVVVIATNGEHGAQPEGLLRPGERLRDRRMAETVESARILGVDRLEFLGYRDSGMLGAPTNEDPDCFWAADIDAAARRLADVLADVLAGGSADLFAIYDPTGITGHPDHIQVHRVGARAAELAGIDLGRVVEGTMSRSQGQRLVRHAMSQDRGEVSIDVDVDVDDFGTPDDAISESVDVREYLDLKRRAMAAHASQISETSMFLSMPDDVFEAVWGRECLIRRGEGGTTVEDLLAGRGRGGPAARRGGPAIPSLPVTKPAWSRVCDT